MAGTTTSDASFDTQLYLSPTQEGLLMQALSSNNPQSRGTALSASGQAGKQSLKSHQQFQQPFLPPDDLFASPQQATPLSTLEAFDIDDSPFLDVLDADGSFDFDTPEDGAKMIGSLPGEADGNMHEKRKSIGGDDEDVEGAAKRREGEDKTAKKPGRKPLTSEPTTKRKAQNRAAQRAFRERKEKHLKDLEVKVSELEKASDAANHENGLLRAQVDRLQTELREYRKRLSLNRSALSNSPPLAGGFSSQLNGLSASNNFQFEFPRFGSLPGSSMLPSTITANTAQSSSISNALPGISRHGSNGQSISPKKQHSRSGSTVNSSTQNGASNGSTIQASAGQQNGSIQSQGNTNDALAGFFSPFIFGGLDGTLPPSDYRFPSTTNAAPSSQSAAESSNGRSRIFQFNSNSTASNSASPRSSSASHYGGPSSSCGTSPEPNHNSPSHTLDTVNENGYVCRGNSEGEVSFCEKLNMACGNPRNPVPRAMSRSNGTPTAPAAAATASNTNNNSSNSSDNTINNNSSKNNNNNNTANNTTNITGSAITSTPGPADINGIDWMATQNGGQFDPLLFGNYRESQAAVVGDGDFTGGFFNDAFPYSDFASPFNFGDAASPAPAPAGPAKPNPLDEIERLQDGAAEDEEEVVPAADRSQLLSCHKIWDKIQDRPDFKEGTFDIDGLCSELRAKARCSESGVVVDQKDVDAALQRLPIKRSP